MSRINIVLDNYQDHCYAGSVISGRLECHFVKPKKYTDIVVRCEGEEKTSWTERERYRGENNRTETRTVYYCGEREVFWNRVCLARAQGRSTEVPPGTYVYPFSFLLPDNLPSTYDSEYGYIYYKITGVVSRPVRPKYQCEMTIVVLSPIDLNKMPQARDPITLEDEKHLCCCWCRSGPVSITATLPHRGFAPGETVTCSAYVQNLSNANVKGITLKLIKHEEYSVTHPSSKTKDKLDVIAKGTFGRIGAHGEHSFNVNLVIPENYRVPNFSGCSLFRVKYYFSAKVKLPCPHTNLSEKVPVMMGNIKLGPRQDFMPLNRFAIPSAPVLETENNGRHEDSSSAGLPSYEQVMQSGGFSGAPQPGMPMPMPMPMPPLPSYSNKE